MIFSDGFESGDATAWSDHVGVDDHGDTPAFATPVDVPSGFCTQFITDFEVGLE